MKKLMKTTKVLIKIKKENLPVKYNKRLRMILKNK